MKPQPAIKTLGLTRYFGSKPALYELNLDVPQGCVFGFLGRNGSGKTTTIRMLLGLLPPTRGGGAVLGCDIRSITPEIRCRIGYMTEEHQLPGWMTVAETEQFQAQFYPAWKGKVFRAVIGHFRLNSSTRVRDLSRGERAGLCLALTLAPDPELLILDDPALGLDPVARRSLLESMIYLTRRSDRTIFFSSHFLSDVERVADYVAVLDQSLLRVCCSVDTFRKRIGRFVLRFDGTPPSTPAVPGLLQSVRTRDEVRVTVVETGADIEAQLKVMKPMGIERVPLSLEEAMTTYLDDRGQKSFIVDESAEVL